MFTPSKNGTLFGGSVASTQKVSGFSAASATPQNVLNPFQSQTTNPFQSQPHTGGAFGTAPVQSTPFGGVPVAQSADSEHMRGVACALTKLTADLAALGQKFDAVLAALNQKFVVGSQPVADEKMYVVCSLHSHPLLETTAKTTVPEYVAGYTCDICQVSYPNRDDKFYQCVNCPSAIGVGKFDICINCVRKQFAK